MVKKKMILKKHGKSSKFDSILNPIKIINMINNYHLEQHGGSSVTDISKSQSIFRTYDNFLMDHLNRSLTPIAFKHKHNINWM